MREKLQPRLNDLLENGYDFKFGTYISESFSILGKYIGGFIGFVLVYIIISFMVNIIPFIGSLVNIVLGPTLIAGAYLVAHKIQKGEQPEFGTFFEGFQRFGEIAIPSILTFIISMLALIPFGIAMSMALGLFSGGFNLEGYMTDAMLSGNFNFPFWTFLLLIPVIYLSVGYIYTILFVLFYNAEPWEAMEASRKVVTKNWFIIFIFGFVVGIIVMLGIIGFGIGIIITMPIAFIAIYVSFADITNLLDDQNRDDDELMDHLVG